ncbi:MAG: tail fiber protein, partial [Cyclobacteriaceae bacterium]
TSLPATKFQVVDGDMLISRTNPGSSLHLRTDSNGNAFINNMNDFVNNGSTNNGSLTITGQSVVRLNVGSDGSSGAEIMRIANSGLSVNGSGLAAGNSTLAINNTSAVNSTESNENHHFTIRRHTSDAESMAVFLQDNRTHFVYQNDEKSSGVDFRLINTDNAGAGASANDNVVMTIYANKDGGSVGIGTTTPDSKLTVKGDIHTREVRVDLAGSVAPDYVFEKDYPLTSLEELKSYIEQHKHLPEIPSAKEMEEEGINLKEMNLMMLKKVEELTLHTISQEEKIERLEKLVEKLIKER